jgi:DNA-binding NtrC family response regulator
MEQSGAGPPPLVRRAPKKPPQKRRSIVIIDDERTYVESMAKLIANNLDCRVHPFTKPEDALAGLDGLWPGVVVTDYFMPEMDGLEFIRKASQIVPEAAFIMISGHDLDPIEEGLSSLKKLKARMQKPFGWQLLAAAILQAWPGDDAPAVRP